MSLAIKDGTGAAQTLRTTVDGSDLVPHHSKKAQSAPAANTGTAGANTAVTITKAAAGAGISNVISEVIWSYNAAPAGSILITDGGTTVIQFDITAAGPGFVQFDPPLRMAANSALVVTLGAGGASVVGKLNIEQWTE